MLKNFKWGVCIMAFFFTSDTHFGHRNIIEYCNRPFKDVVEMDKILVQKYNYLVQENDIVYFLGDIGFLLA